MRTNTNKRDDKESVLSEFDALRQETLSSINARVWGVLTSIALAGGAAALYEQTKCTIIFVLLVFSMLPLLWHTANRERSRVRIGVYIKVVLESKADLNWERYLAEWRSKFTPDWFDCWRHIFSLTGIYILIALFGLFSLFKLPASTIERILGIIGFVLCIESHWYFNRVYKQISDYEDIFKDLRKKDEEQKMEEHNERLKAEVPEGN